MLKRIFALVSLFVVSMFILAGCSSENNAQVSASLGQEFTLPVGQTVSIQGENLSIKFNSVTGDSRCPTGAQCVWAGEAKCELSIRYSTPETKNATAAITLTETGGTDGYSQASWINNNAEYKFKFKLTPYPAVGTPVPSTDYKLIMTVSK